MAVSQVSTGKQYLGHLHPVNAKETLVHGHQARLTHSSQHLLGVQQFWQVGEVQCFTAGCDGAGRDQHHLSFFSHQCRKLTRQIHQMWGGKFFAAAGEGGGADLDDNALRRGHNLLPDKPI
ncbi:hypothetical protein SDC9_181377 [bioreactor metagenome]|uniref:Uncharacterized protein n=1 Tax=bioreactor metagenome TaxID=1076179 RepID=A0A645H4D8_9ZZZZ